MVKIIVVFYLCFVNLFGDKLISNRGGIMEEILFNIDFDMWLLVGSFVKVYY